MDEIFQCGWNMQVLRIRSKFWGKSMEFQPEGEVRAKYFISQIFCKFLNLDIFNQNSGAIKTSSTILDVSLLESFGQTWQFAKVWSVLAIHLKNFTSGESETERLGGGVHLEQSHQLPSQPAWCWEVDWHQPQIQNTGFEIHIHNLHAAEIAWHHKYKIPNICQVQIYNFPTPGGLTSTGRALSRAHPPDFLLGFSLSRLPTGAVRGALAFSFFTASDFYDFRSNLCM